MAISYPLTMPDDDWTAAKVGAQFNNLQTPSISNVVQTVSKPGDLLILEFSLPRKSRASAAEWQAWGMSLRGSFGSFYGYDRTAKTARGVATGTPLVNGADQTGYELVTDGWTTSQTGILLAGDWIEVNGLLRMVVADADSDVSGNATLDISPGLWPGQSPADNAAITVSNPKGKFRLVGDMISWDIDLIENGMMKFQAIEDLRA